MSLVIPAQAGIQKLKSNKHVLYFHNVSDDTILQHFTSFEPYYSVVSTGVPHQLAVIKSIKLPSMENQVHGFNWCEDAAEKSAFEKYMPRLYSRTICETLYYTDEVTYLFSYY
jgi:hypothetical protein